MNTKYKLTEEEITKLKSRICRNKKECNKGLWEDGHGYDLDCDAFQNPEVTV